MAEMDKKEQEKKYGRQMAFLRTQEREKARNTEVSDQLKDWGKAVGNRTEWLGKKENFKKFEKTLGKGVKKINLKKAQRRSMGGWVIILIICLVKDLIDMGTIGASWVISWVVNPIMAVLIFFLIGRSLKLSRKLITTVGPAILEMIPISEFMWWWTLSAIYIYWKAQGVGEEE